MVLLTAWSLVEVTAMTSSLRRIKAHHVALIEHIGSLAGNIVPPPLAKQRKALAPVFTNLTHMSRIALVVFQGCHLASSGPSVCLAFGFLAFLELFLITSSDDHLSVVTA
eukprot:TRINITY_DN2259_c0_g1_i1.p2 TRINITY_DN2259_c0_g1~~TRINITY_DN2259_c0_g1_i1.p2  ORF type:complete len:110 (+),score=4.88 TRINITY_DN2259_c0_g1_i1:220-549(+)